MAELVDLRAWFQAGELIGRVQTLIRFAADAWRPIDARRVAREDAKRCLKELYRLLWVSQSRSAPLRRRCALRREVARELDRTIYRMRVRPALRLRRVHGLPTETANNQREAS